MSGLPKHYDHWRTSVPREVPFEHRVECQRCGREDEGEDETEFLNAGWVNTDKDRGWLADYNDNCLCPECNEEAEEW